MGATATAGNGRWCWWNSGGGATTVGSVCGGTAGSWGALYWGCTPPGSACDYAGPARRNTPVELEAELEESGEVAGVLGQVEVVVGEGTEVGVGVGIELGVEVGRGKSAAVIATPLAADVGCSSPDYCRTRRRTK